MVSYSCRRRFADSHQGVFDGEDGLFIVREGLRVQAFGKPLNVPDRLGVAKPSWLTGLTRPSLHAQRRYRWPGQARPRRVRGQCRIQREGTHDEPGRADPAGHDQRGHAGFLDPSEIRQSRSGVLAASSTRAPGAACDDDVRGPWATPAKSWIAHSMLGLAVCLPQDVVQHARSGIPGDVTDRAFAQKRIRPV